MPVTGSALRRHRHALGVAVVAVLVVCTGGGFGVASAVRSLATEPVEIAPRLVGSVDTLALRADLGTVDDAVRRATTAAPSSGRVFVTPVPGSVRSAEFGDRGGHWGSRHTGVDFRAPRGTPAYAVTDGVVVKTAWHKAYGNMVIIEVSPGVTVWYCHLSKVLVEPGPISSGDRVGLVGSSGNATGSHLHLEVRVWDRPTDPDAFLYGMPAGEPGPPPSWLSPVPVTTVAALQWRRWADGHPVRA